MHAAAQQKLIECFPEIATRENTLIYSTHSHYMIEPKWLEQTFIVTNRNDADPKSMLDELSLNDESLNIQATSYRSFVNQHPNQTSYFQPILDRLAVVPSRFDLRTASVVLEGKSDYYILRYVSKMLARTELPLLPASGATTFDALAALHAGWNLNLLFVLDGDKEGSTERRRYIKNYGISPDRVVTINELVTGLTVIEDLLDDDASYKIATELRVCAPPSKAEIRRFFQERLASNRTEVLSSTFEARSKALFDQLELRTQVVSAD